MENYNTSMLKILNNHSVDYTLKNGNVWVLDYNIIGVPNSEVYLNLKGFSLSELSTFLGY